MNTLKIDNSSLDKWIACPRAGQYYLEHKRERAGISAALNCGSAMHLALEHRYKNHSQSIEQVEPGMLSSLEKWYGANPHPEGDHRTLSRLSDVVKAYNKEYPADNWEVLGVEIPFEEPLGQVFLENDESWSVVWQGRIDMLIRVGQEVFVVDHKTMGRRDSSLIAEYTNASGPLGYCWAVQERAKAQPDKVPARVTGFLLNAILIRDGEVTTRTKLPRQEFERHAYHYDQSRIAEWHTDTLELCRRYLQDKAYSTYPMHRRSCVGRYGACPYIDVCQLPFEHRLAFLGTDVFRDVTWSPLADRV